MRKHTIVLALLLFVVSVATGCSSGKPASSAKVLTLGGIFPLTGSSAVYGASSKNAMSMAVDEFTPVAELLSMAFRQPSGPSRRMTPVHPRLVRAQPRNLSTRITLSASSGQS